MTNVLLLYNDFIPSVRLCGYEQLNYLKELGKIEFVHSNVRDLTSQQAKDADVVFMVRSDSFLEMKIAEKLKKAGKYLIYVLDDDLLNIPDNLSSSNYYKRKEVKDRMQKIMSLCHCLCSPSPRILGKYGDGFGKTVLIEEPALFISSHKVINKNEKIKIGFAGSIDRSADIDILIDEAIRKIIIKYKDKVEISFFGSKPKLIDKYNIKHYPYENDYNEYQKKMIDLSWDIGLAPMQDTTFHNSKHYNKYIEYSSFGIIGIYSNVIPYTDVIVNGQNGLLCDNTTDSWVKAISNLVDDSYRRNVIKEIISKDMKERFSIKSVSKNFALSFEEIFRYKAPNCHGIYLFLYKRLDVFVKSLNFIRRNGAKFPLELAKKIRRM